jgi:hypothetical protein
MSTNYKNKKGLTTGILYVYSGKLAGLVFQKNGHIRINKQLLIKRRKKK